MIEVIVHFEQLGASTAGVSREFDRVPVQGEVIRTGDKRYVVAGVEWQLDGKALVVAQPMS